MSAKEELEEHGSGSAHAGAAVDIGLPTGDGLTMMTREGEESPAQVPIAPNYAGSNLADEDVTCGVCLEKPAEGCYAELWCCGNVLCVNDAQQLGRCPFCREEPMAWSIENKPCGNMVVVKGTGQTYSIGNGRQVEWDDVPEGFKQKLREQREIVKCVDMREEAQRCIAENGFWHSKCVELTEAFHACQANELARTEPSLQKRE